MNFQELMSKAAANKVSATKQNARKPGHQHKDSTPGITSSAVKAFLAKKQQEQKEKQAEEEAARLARIQARLDQNLKANLAKKSKRNKDSAPQSSSLNPPYMQEQDNKPSKIQKKEGPVAYQKREQKFDSVIQPKTTIAGSKDVKEKSKDSQVQLKKVEKDSEGKVRKNYKPAVNGKSNLAMKSKKKIKAGPPPNFRELLAIAEKNKSGLNNVKTETCTNKKRNVDAVRVKESKKSRQNGIGEKKRKFTEDEKNVQMKAKEEMDVKTKGKHVELKRKAVEKSIESSKHKGIQLQGKASLSEGSKKLKRTEEPLTNTRDILIDRPQRPGPYNGKPFEPPRRMYQQNNYYPNSRSSYLDDYYEEEDSDLDGFIDDGSDDACGGNSDVSAHIREIFGYDRRRFAAMDDFDDAAMESSYGQIEREEKRSAKIAKLEDEIDILKEQAELKRLRDKLKNSKKSKKKK